MKQLQFSITELKRKAADGPFHFKEKIDVSDLANIESNDIRRIDDVDIEGFVVANQRELIFSFTLTGEMVLPCARTLVDVTYPFEIQADEVFTEDVPQADDEEVHHVSGDMLDLTPYIKENIILRMPYRVFSDEAGLEEGEGWELYDEESFADAQRNSIDPRLSKLQQLMDKNKED